MTDVPSPPRPRPAGVADLLFEEGYAFDFFQAVRLLERMSPGRRPVGGGGPARAEAARFRAHLSLSFPPSPIYEVGRPTADLPVPAVTVAFLGLHGPSGVLPPHYTELMLRLEREGKGPDARALRAWLDLFNHRLISLFYRAWEKYRFFIPYERGEYAGREPDPFTRAVFSLAGLGFPSLRGRLRVEAVGGGAGARRARPLAEIDDLALLHYAGFLAHRPRNALSLEAMLRDYFGVELRVLQFRGQWLPLGRADQTRLGGSARLGVDAVAGERVWDVQAKIRVCLGPLRYARFDEFLPDPAPAPARKAFFLLARLVRLYVGPELDFDVQLVLKAADVPACRLGGAGGGGAHLGWNTWALSAAPERDAEDAVFEGEEVVCVGDLPRD